MKSRYNIFLLFLSLVFLAFTSCKDEWNSHNELTEASLSDGILKAINDNTDLGKFSELLKKTGYDKVIASSKMFTVWAPNNTALASLPDSIANDSVKLKQFVGNHIAYQEYYTYSPKPSLRIKTLCGKYVNIYQGKDSVEGVAIVQKNQFYKNGVLQVLSGYIVPKYNIWEYLSSTSASSLQRDYMKSLTHGVFVDSLAKQTGVNANGQPIYDTISGTVQKNTFLQTVADVNNEDSIYTYFILTDDAYQHEYTKMFPYLSDTSSKNQIFNTNWAVAKDLVFRGKIIASASGDTIVSTQGIKIPFDKSAIVSQYTASNGIVYVLNKCDVRLQDKIPPVIIEGENYMGYNHTTDLLGIRIRAWASGEKDLLVKSGHGYTDLYVSYRTPYLYTLPYKFYWVAHNDFQTTLFNQTLAIDSALNKTYFGACSINPNNNNEVTVVGAGDNTDADIAKSTYTVTIYRRIPLYVKASSTTANNSAKDYNTNPILLDYIKLYPVFQ